MKKKLCAVLSAFFVFARVITPITEWYVFALQVHSNWRRKKERFCTTLFLHHQQHSNVSFVRVREIFFTGACGFCGPFCPTGLRKLSVSNLSLQVLFSLRALRGLCCLQTTWRRRASPSEACHEA